MAMETYSLLRHALTRDYGNRFFLIKQISIPNINFIIKIYYYRTGVVRWVINKNTLTFPFKVEQKN
jgi:hypothetical protein